MRIKGCLTSNNQVWKTPSFIYGFYVGKLGYFDPCPINPTFDGLSISWKEKNFVNPPYNQIDKWIEKSIYEFSIRHVVVLLIPCRTDTQWFKKLVMCGATFEFIEGRLKFNDGKKSAPFPSMIVTLDLHLVDINKGCIFNYLSRDWFDTRFRL